MATQLPDVFNPDDQPDDPLLPDGWYAFEISETEFCVSQNKASSTYIKVTLDGRENSPAAGMRIWQNFTYNNENATAVRLGRRAFAKLCKAAGCGSNVHDTAILHGRAVMGQVYTEKGTGGYEDKNQIKDFQSINGAGVTGAPPVPGGQQAGLPYQPPGPPQQQPQQAYQPPAPPQQQPPQQQPQQAYQPPAPPQQPGHAPQQGYQQPPYQPPGPPQQQPPQQNYAPQQPAPPRYGPQQGYQQPPQQGPPPQPQPPQNPQGPPQQLPDVPAWEQ